MPDRYGSGRSRPRGRRRGRQRVGRRGGRVRVGLRRPRPAIDAAGASVAEVDVSSTSANGPEPTGCCRTGGPAGGRPGRRPGDGPGAIGWVAAWRKPPSGVARVKRDGARRRGRHGDLAPRRRRRAAVGRVLQGLDREHDVLRGDRLAVLPARVVAQVEGPRPCPSHRPTSSRPGRPRSCRPGRCGRGRRRPARPGRGRPAAGGQRRDRHRGAEDAFDVGARARASGGARSAMDAERGGARSGWPGRR